MQRTQATGGASRARRCRGRLLAGVAALALGLSAPLSASIAQPIAAAPEASPRFSTLNWHGVGGTALTLGILLYAVACSVLLVRLRRRNESSQAALKSRVGALAAEADRINALLLAEPQVIVAWNAADETPDVLGDVALVHPSSNPLRVLAFGCWLDAEQAQAMDHAVEALRRQGQSFARVLRTQAGGTIEAQGRAISGRAVLRLRPVDGLRRELAELSGAHDALRNEAEALRTLADALPHPLWARDAKRALAFTNPAYASAVEARGPADAAARGLELIDRTGRDDIAGALAAGTPYRGLLMAIAAGTRRAFDVLEVPVQGGGSAGIGLDRTDAEALRADLDRLTQAHRRTLDQLTTGVAIYDAQRRLIFHNEAFRALWELDAAFLAQEPSDAAVLDTLRAARKLPEERDFREWKAVLHEAYRATEPAEHLWHLPDGRARRVVTTPNLEGGVTYLFEDLTERFDLKRRYDSLSRVQGETLDNLGEAVAVFGSDGRVRLHNPAFARMWKLDPDVLAARPHIEIVIDWCRALYGDEELWRRLRATATAIDGRDPVSGRLERKDGTIVDLCTVPLPDGATLLTFRDVTDSIKVERGLIEKNDALEQADLLKVEFVHHVSYELRSPLTNIIGFAHFLGEDATGPLNDKQREYLGYINASTTALLAIINDILDLATIDAGAMKLNVSPVDIRKTMEAAAEGIRDRLTHEAITLHIKVRDDIGTFAADEWRIRQILFNLLANAVGFSPAGGVITLDAQRLDGALVITVADNGPGIPADVQDRVFDWFESHPQGSRHRGAGLGLSLVRSFVELHGGTVELDSMVGRGTIVTCTFPMLERERPAA